jgi:aspartate oxidase
MNLCGPWNQVKQGTASLMGFYVDLSHSRYHGDVVHSWRHGLHQFTNLKHVGIDLGSPMKMAPCHYCLGGIKIDDLGRTNVEGLYAAGK